MRLNNIISVPGERVEIYFAECDFAQHELDILPKIIVQRNGI